MAIDNETRAALQGMYLPPQDDVLSDDDTYKEWCDARIREELKAVAVRNAKVAEAWDEAVEGIPLPDQYKRAMIRTHYPSDDYLSEDVVGLDEDGNIEIIDAGSR